MRILKITNRCWKDKKCIICGKKFEENDTYWEIKKHILAHQKKQIIKNKDNFTQLEMIM